MDQITKPEIRVDETPVDAGVNFMLYPSRSAHTDEDVEQLKAELHRTREVITIRTTWVR